MSNQQAAVAIIPAIGYGIGVLTIIYGLVKRRALAFIVGCGIVGGAALAAYYFSTHVHH